MEANEPKGCVMIVTDPQGRSVGEVVDFELQGYGGFTLKEAQRIRCKRQIARVVIDRYASPIIGETMADYHRDELLKKLLNDKGYRLHEVYVGHGDDNAD